MQYPSNNISTLTLHNKYIFCYSEDFQILDIHIYIFFSDKMYILNESNSISTDSNINFDLNKTELIFKNTR